MIIDDTIKFWRRTAFEWGQSDCLLSIGDYLALCGYQDVTGLFRGTYDDEATALGLVASHGGSEGLIDMTGVPRCHIDQLTRGDVVLFDTGTGEPGALIAALYNGDTVVGRIERGTVEIAARFVKIVQAWKV